MFERYTDRAKRAVELAGQAARDMRHDSLDTGHLLIGLIGEGGGVAYTALTGLGLTPETVREAVWRNHPGNEDVPAAPAVFTPWLKAALEFARRESLELGNNFIATEHLLLGLIREGKDVGALALADCGIAEGDDDFLADVRAKVHELLRGYAESGRAASPAVPAEAARAAERQALAWELVGRMRKFLGRIEDMGDDERLFMLGALTGALEGMLRDAGAPGPPCL